MPSLSVLRLVTTALAVSLAVTTAWVALSPTDGALAEYAAFQPRRVSPRWAPPDWLPEDDDLWALEQMGGAAQQRGPRLRSTAAFVFDVDAGAVLVDHNADVVQPVASITKLVSALAMVSTDHDLDRTICIGPEHYPTRSGAFSKLSTGDCIEGWDALGAALVASDNRGAYALASAAGLGVDDFVERMNEVSADLGMDLSSWTDPSGLEDENLSTARDIARATLAVAMEPVLSEVASAPYWDVHYARKPMRRRHSTNRLAERPDLEVLAAKTGYTDTAGYCYATALRLHSGRHVVITLLGAHRNRDRWADVATVLRWIEAQG
jgi:D-alanyl-D-alanine endopeptidase (penicillin-binding protein 7)